MELTSPSSPADIWSPTQKPKHLAHTAGKQLDFISGSSDVVHQTIMKLE